MKKLHHYLCIAILLSVCMLPLAVKSQVIINPHLPPAGAITKQQLWNLTIVNNQQNISHAVISLTLQETKTGQVVLNATSNIITLNKGVTVISDNDVQPAVYNYASSDFNSNFLPLGSYIGCYEIHYPKDEAQVLIASECTRFNIDPLSPPLLNTPLNKSKVATPYPSFTWTPPSPVDMFNELNYDLLVSEVLQGQSPEEAIQYNTPVYITSNIAWPNHNYPSTFTKLDTGKVYAWQVIAKNGISYAAKTDVWTFTVNKEVKPNPVFKNDYYILLEDNLNDIYIIPKNKLYLKYFSFDKEWESPISIYDVNSGEEVLTVSKKIKQGDNYIDIDLSHKFRKGAVYKVSIKDISGITKSLLFTIKESKLTDVL